MGYPVGVHISELRKGIKEGRVITIVGAGVSMATTSGVEEASWMGLLWHRADVTDKLRYDYIVEKQSVFVREIHPMWIDL